MTLRTLSVFLILMFAITSCSDSSSRHSKTLSFATDEGSWISLDVAPSGDYLVFELLGDIYTLPITGGIAKPLIKGREFMSQPRFSPDGKTLVFVSDRSGEDNLWLARADGSNVRQLSARRDGEFISPSWSSDGQIIYVSQLASRRSMRGNVELWAYPVDGREPTKIDTPDMGMGSMLVSTFPPGAYGPALLPGTNKLFFTAATPRQHGDASGPHAQIMWVNLDTGETDIASTHDASTFRPQLSVDAKWLVYGAVRGNTTGLRARSLESGEEHWVLTDIGFNAMESWASRDMLPGFAFTPDKASLVIAYKGKINRVSLGDGQVTNIPFSAAVDIEAEARVISTAKIEPGPVTARIAKGATISPDGTQFAFSAFGRLHKMTVADQRLSKLTSQSAFGEFHPAWSPDGKWLTFVTWTAPTGGAVWKIPADNSRAAERITTDNAYYRDPVWSNDGKSIYAITAPKNVRLENAYGSLARAEQLVALAVDGTGYRTIGPAAGAVRVHFTNDPQRYYAYSPRLGLSSWKQDGSEQTSHLRVMGKANPTSFPAMASDILLSPDGENALAAVAHQLYLVDMSAVDTEQATVNVYAPGNAYTKITDQGADHFSWADSTTLAWSAGNTLYLRDIISGKTTQIDARVQRARQHSDASLVLRGADIITMKGNEIIRDGDILIEGQRITGVAKTGVLDIPDTATIIDTSGKTIMPGIVDIHAHWNVKRSVLDLEDHNAYANLAYGVTTIRDPQSITDDIFSYSDAVKTGEMIGPRIFSTGRGVFFFNNFQSYEQVYAVLERYKKKYRTHLLKSYLPGNRQVRQWIVEASRELGLIVTAEGGSDAKMNITFAVDGFSGNEHAVPIVPLRKDIIQLFAQSGISYTPTLLVSFGGPFAVDHFIANRIGLEDDKLQRFMPAHLIAQRVAMANEVEPEDHIFADAANGAKQILDSGGNVGLGGHGEMQGLQVHWEMWALSAGGMSNLNVLRVATLESAKAIGLDDDIGSIEIGKLADLLVMDKNPLDDISHTNTISEVMVNGSLYDAHTLAQQWPQKKDPPRPWWHEITPED